MEVNYYYYYTFFGCIKMLWSYYTITLWPLLWLFTYIEIWQFTSYPMHFLQFQMPYLGQKKLTISSQFPRSKLFINFCIKYKFSMCISFFSKTIFYTFLLPISLIYWLSLCFDKFVKILKNDHQKNKYCCMLKLGFYNAPLHPIVSMFAYSIIFS